MSSGITICIKLEEHLQHFYSGKVGVDFLIRKRNAFFNTVIFPYLKNRKDFIHIKIDSNLCFEFELQNYKKTDVRSGKWYIPEESFDIIERILEHHFDAVFNAHMVRYTTMQDAIYDFGTFYGMEISERTFGMLKKRFYRARTDEELEMNVKKHKKHTRKMSFNVLQISPCTI